MKTKLKPLRFPGRVEFERLLDFHKLKKRAESFLSERRADSLAFHLWELDEACETFRRDVKRLFKALHAARRDSTDLYDSAAAVSGQFDHFRWHMSRAGTVMSRLMSEASKLPPLDQATDLELTERALEPFDKYFEAAGIKKKRAGKTKTKKVKKRAAGKKTKKKRRKKT